MAATIAMAVNTDGRRKVLGMATGASEAETFWTDFLRPLTWCSLRGVKLVISDAHVGLKAPVSRVLGATWQPVPGGAAEHSIFGGAENLAYFFQPDPALAVSATSEFLMW